MKAFFCIFVLIMNTITKSLSAFVLSLTVGGLLSPVAKADLPLRSRVELSRIGTELKEKPSRSVETYHVNALVKLQAGTDESVVEELGANIVNRIGDVLIISVPLKNVEQISKLSGVQRVELDRKSRPMMREARKSGNIDAIISGEGLDGHSFDGSGVVAGIFDTGIDPNHPNFAGRDMIFLNYYVNNVSGQGMLDIWEGDEIKDFTTDNNGDTHGTHTLGIMAGSAESIDHLFLPDYEETAEGLKMTIDRYEGTENPVKGIATGAKLAAAGSATLYNSFIIDGVGRIVDYANELGLPAVVNLSLGSNGGPHDNSDIYSYMISEIGKNSIIVVAAGNEGGDSIAMMKNFNKTETLRTFIKPINTVEAIGSTSSRFNHNYPQIELWGRDDQVMEINLLVTTAQGEIVQSYPFEKFVEDENLADEDQLTPYGISLARDFSKEFTTGMVYPIYEIDETNNRLTAFLYGENVTAKKTTGGYRLGIEVIGKAGQRIDINSLGGQEILSAWDIEGWTGADGNMSINNLATGENVIVVGAWASEIYFANLNGQVLKMQKGNEKGDLAWFSSWGELVDGRSLPHITAPGSLVVSSLNSYYTDQVAQDDLNNMSSGKSTVNNRNYYWQIEQGTSMSAPFVTGVITLWQQASVEKNGRPLSCAEVLDLIRKTAINDEFTAKGNPVTWGAGKINAFEGIKTILGTTAIGAVSINEKDKDNSLMFRLQNRNLEVLVAGATALNLDIYSVMGQQVGSYSSASNEMTHSLENLLPGIYIVKITSPEGNRYTRKITLK